MAKKKVSESIYDFSYGEQHAHTTVSAADIIHLEDGKPGLYAWYVRVLPNENSADDLARYGMFFGSKRYNIDMSAHLNETYTGDLTMSYAFDATRPANNALISTITTVFSPPIYVGIAKNARSRLMTHLNNLKASLITAAPPPAPATGSASAIAISSPPPAIDTEEESSYFGGRVAQLLKNQGITDARHLFVKIVFQPVNNPAERRAVEHFANRVFFPFCGRR